MCHSAPDRSQACVRRDLIPYPERLAQQTSKLHSRLLAWRSLMIVAESLSATSSQPSQQSGARSFKQERSAACLCRWNVLPVDGSGWIGMRRMKPLNLTCEGAYLNGAHHDSRSKEQTARKSRERSCHSSLASLPRMPHNSSVLKRSMAWSQSLGFCRPSQHQPKGKFNSSNAPVAQLDRASDFESAGRPFESGRAHHLKSNNQIARKTGRGVKGASVRGWVRLGCDLILVCDQERI